ncbi:SusC/RagA family TonB-linked outer membrane protein [Siphonobacter aquaeclarae]|uniref:TonB-linked outer membrane protein, SusC/RagA family n=1 Tax=Siphonobacter aquaeclarae TaxID=563176 RepID=A0A1G9JQH0_9BACT|nr:TonB-dependent receptor [Siphonobacter aquaeclarae]SDL39800.1 TonB-linked outer membrane protein, SusC/RagA family [Siphonobacter aquaeclarae]
MKERLFTLLLLAAGLGCGMLQAAALPGHNRLYAHSADDIPAAEITVRGRVTDREKGEGIPGVNVVLKNSRKGTTTDADGNYSIVISTTADVLVFSSVGFATQEITVGDRTLLNVTLESDARALDEVVVVGYGSQSRRNVTGSVAKIDMKQTENLPNTNVTQSLRGRVAGVQFTDSGRPGQNGSILIRGPRSLGGGNDPLIVLDGIFFNGSLADINPNDIESMEVLKDASAAAIYGSRAANGVILITSRRGTTRKPTIRVNAFTGVSEMGRTVKLLSPERYLQKTLDYRTQSGLPSDPASVASYLTTTEAANYKAGNVVDPWKAASQPGRMDSYDLSLSGRNEATNYYLSAAFTNEKGVILQDNQKRVTLRTNIENQVTNWLSVGMNTTFVRRDLSGREADVASIYYSSPFGTWTYPDGEPTQYTVPEDQVSGQPIRAALLTKNEEIYNNLFSNFYGLVNIPFVKGLSFRVNYSPNYRWNHTYNFVRQDRRLTNNTTSANKYNQESFDWVLENILTYTKQIGKNHGLDVTLLYGRNHQQSESTTANANQLSSDALGWNSLTLGGTQTTTSAASMVDGISSMARLNYRFKDRYLLTLTARRDASSVFAANNKYATFPSAALAWIVSDESFMRKATAVDLLKFRLSYGAVGNQAIQPYQSLGLSGITQYVYGDGGPTSVGIYPSTMANSNLKWETTYTANAAIDFSLFKGRLGGTVEVYNSDTKNLIVQRSLPTLTGYTSVLTNLGATNNKGIELTFNTVNLRKKNFEWSSNIVLSANRNKIVHLYRSDTNGDGQEDNDLINRWFIGQPVTVYYDYVFDGIYQQGDQIPNGSQPGFIRFKDLNGDGKIDATNDRTIIGQGGQPKIRWGVTNNFSYGNLSLSVFVNAMQGWISDFILLDPNSTKSENSPGRALNQIDAGWWTADNKSDTRPSLVYTNPLGYNYYVSRNFVRIQDVSLAYNFPAKWVKKVHGTNLRVFASAKNLYTFTKWPGTDPESGGTTKSSFYPMPRTYTVGLNLGF